MIFHRWERIEYARMWRCVDADLGGVNSGQRCWPGCHAEVTDLEVAYTGLSADKVTVDFIARAKGFHGVNGVFA